MSDSRKPHLARLLGAFLAVSVGMGLVGAGLVIPLAGATGSAARSTTAGFMALDSEFTANPLSQQSKILSADGKVLATPYNKNRIVVPLKKISPWMQKAQLAIEDSRFYEHGGLDIRGTLRAFVTNLSSSQTQGGSSITQQYVKLMIQEKSLRQGNQEAAQQATASSGIAGYSRKLQELKYALNVEETHTKDQILASYLNIAYYGGNAYGVEAAAQHFFSKSADDLNIVESATLAGVVQSPGVLNIVKNPEAVRERRDVVLNRMHDLDVISKKQLDEATSQSVESYTKISQNEGGSCSDAADPYFCNYVINYLKQMPELGPNPDARMMAVNTGGLTIKTTLRRDWQKKLKEQLTDRVPNGTDKFGAGGAIVEPGTGDVKAIAQTSKYKIGLEKASTKYSEQAWSVPAQYGGTNGFSIGSTAKVYTLVAALEQGMPLDAKIDAPTAGEKESAKFTRGDFEKGCTTVEPWMVGNSHLQGGKMSLGEATKNSVNTAFAQIATKIGSCNIPKVMAKMGLTDGYGLPYGLAYDSSGEKVKDTYAISSLVLGSDSTTPLQLASSYATLSADGEYCPPNPIKSITTANGTKMKIDPPPCKQVIDKGVARGATSLLEGVLNEGTASGDDLANGREAAGKTGTTDNHHQSWFTGYTRRLSTAIWVGSPIEQHEMEDVTIDGQRYDQVSGSTIAAPIWSNIMNEVLEGKGQKDFKDPPKSVKEGDVTSIPDVIGMGPTQATQKLEDAGFEVDEGGQVDSNVQPGAVAYTSPRDEAREGETVTIHISNGQAPTSGPSTSAADPPSTFDPNASTDDSPPGG